MSPKVSFPIKFILSLLLLVLTLVVSFVFGAADISLKEVWLALFSTSSSDGIGIIREIWLPREIAAIFVGAALAFHFSFHSCRQLFWHHDCLFYWSSGRCRFSIWHRCCEKRRLFAVSDCNRF